MIQSAVYHQRNCLPDQLKKRTQNNLNLNFKQKSQTVRVMWTLSAVLRYNASHRLLRSNKLFLHPFPTHKIRLYYTWMNSARSYACRQSQVTFFMQQHSSLTLTLLCIEELLVRVAPVRWERERVACSSVLCSEKGDGKRRAYIVC